MALLSFPSKIEAVCLALCFASLSPAALAAGTYVAGDSIGVGIAQVAHLPSVAQSGAPTASLSTQLSRVPHGSTVIVSTGTNDALAGRSSAPLPSRPDLKLIYVGPPCVATAWNATQARFRTFLAGRTRHVSLPCLTGRDRARDGIHFTGTGYAKLWAVIRRSL